MFPCVRPISPSPGPVVLSSSAQLVAPVLVARGTLSITTSEIYFEVDEDDPAFKRVDPKVSNLQEADEMLSVVLPVKETKILLHLIIYSPF